MDLWMYNAYIEGASAKDRSIQQLAVYTGFWTGYYNNSKHPQKPLEILARAQASSPQKGGDPDCSQFDTHMLRFEKWQSTKQSTTRSM